MKTLVLPAIQLAKGLFIRSGLQGQLAPRCIAEGVVILDFHEMPHDLCQKQQWDQVRASFPEAKDGAIPTIISKLKHFYESDETALWLTRHEGQWWYCFAQQPVEPQADGTRLRRVVEPWRCFDAYWQKRLDCELGSLRRFPGALCTLNEDQLACLQTCLNAHGAAVPTDNRSRVLAQSVASMLPLLNHSDLKTLITKTLQHQGWQPIANNHPEFDLVLESTSRDALIGVQVKPHASQADWEVFLETTQALKAFQRFYLVAPTVGFEVDDPGDRRYQLLQASELAQQVLEAGLSSWVMEQVSLSPV